MSHKFKIGQRVRQPGPNSVDSKGVINGPYEVVRLMPSDQTGEPSYRIRSTTGERAARENDLVPA